MPVLPLVGSIRTVLPGVILPAFSAASIMAKPMRSFTLDAGFWLSSLATTVAGKPGCHAVQPHQRGAANQFSYIRGNARHNDLLFPGNGPDC